MRYAHQIFSIPALAIGAVLSLFGTGGADAQTFFQQAAGQPGVVVSYDEIVAEDVVRAAPPAGANSDSSSVKGTTVPCIDGFSHANCGREYNGFFAYDLNSDGTHVVGSLGYDAGTPQSQAAVWNPDLGGFVLLDDASQAFALGSFGTIVPSATETGSAALDITATTGTIVGIAKGTYTEGIIGCDPCGIVGTDTPQQIVPSGQTIDWFLPLIWQQTGENSWGTGQVLPMLVQTPDDILEEFFGPVGGAYGINEAGTYIAGWNGEVGSYDGDNPDFAAVQAVRWSVAGGVAAPPLGLGYLESDVCGGSDERECASVGNDVNDQGVVVGWSGYLDSGCACTEVRLAAIPGGSIFPDRNADWSPSPFVWNDVNGMMPLSKVEPNTGLPFADGEARALANGNSVAVGFVFGKQVPANPPADTGGAAGPFPGDNTFDPLSPQDFYAAAWIHPGDPNWAENQLVVLGMTEGEFGPDGDTVPDFSVANAVDASGQLIVGKVGTIDFCEGFCGTVDTAAFWELDSSGNLLRGATIQDAMRDAGVPVSSPGHETGSDSPDAGAVNELRLTEATAVRVASEADGTKIYVTGVGEGSFGSWIANIAGGISTPPSLARSLAVLGQGAADISEVPGVVAENQRCVRPEGKSADEAPWCFFVVGNGALFVNTGIDDGIELGKQVGIARFFDDDTQVGGSFGLNHINGTVYGSTYSALVLGGGVYVAHEPKEGLQAVASAAFGKVLTATFARNYVNGFGNATSTGTTDGWAGSLYGKLGYSTTVTEGTRVIPFVSATVTHGAFAAFSDTGGPFNASVSAQTVDTTTLTAGVRAEHDLNPQRMIYGELSLSAVKGSGTGSVFIAGGTAALGASSGWQTVGSMTGGIKQEFDSSSNGYAQVTLSTDLSGYFSAAVVAGYDKSF